MRKSIAFLLLLCLAAALTDAVLGTACISAPIAFMIGKKNNA